MLYFLKTWNDKYDFWSLFSDFIFVFGYLALDWDPILLVFLFIIDSGVMSMFANILFYLEEKSLFSSFGFLMISILMLFGMLGIFESIFQFMKELQIEGMEKNKPFEAMQVYVLPVLSSYILPIILVSSGLNHYATFSESLQKMKNDTYTSTFIKHFFLRYLFLVLITLLMVVGQYYFNVSIIIGLIAVKAILRLWKRKYRTII